MVVLSIRPECSDFPGDAIQIHPTNHVAVHTLQSGPACVHVPVVFDFACLVIFCGKIQCFGLQTKVDVFGDEHHLRFGFCGLQAQCSVKDFVVIGLFREDLRGRSLSTLGIHDDFQFATKTVLHRDPLL